MKVPKSDRLEYFKSLYDDARAAFDVDIEQLEKNYKQYKGDREIDPLPDGTPTEPASVVMNITYELIESQTTTYIPIPKCNPVSMSERSVRCAMATERMLKAQRDRLPSEALNDLDERYTYVYGSSIWFVEWDESTVSHAKSGDVKLHCISPRRFVGQPYIYNVQDMEYLFLSFETTKEHLERSYGISFSDTEETVNDEGSDDKTATMYVCFYKDDEGCVCQYAWSGDVEIIDLEDYYARKGEKCKICGRGRNMCECEDPEFEKVNDEFEELEVDIVLNDGKTVIPAKSPKIGKDGLPIMKKTKKVKEGEGSGYTMDPLSGLTLPITEEIEEPVLEPTRIKYYKPRSFPVVVRKNTSKEDSVYGQSDCEFIRDQQQGINKLETRIMQKLMRSSVTPVVPEGATIRTTNGIYDQVIELTPGMPKDYGVIDTQVDITRDLAQVERLYNQAKRCLGISDSFQGHYDPSAKSGVAKRTAVMQSAGRLDSKRMMKNVAWQGIDRIMFELCLAYADEPRPVTYIDEFGVVQEISFSRYDFLLQDDFGEWYYDDEYLFSCDAAADVITNRELLWQENRLNFKEGVYGDPADPKTQLAFWINMERAHYPFAREQVTRIQAVIREAAMMQEMQQQIASLESQNQALGEENALRREYSDKLYDVARREGDEIDMRAEYEKYLLGKKGGNV